MGERKLLRIVVALNNIRHEYRKILTTFYVGFNKSINEIAHQVSEDEICRMFHKTVDLQNKASKKLRNNYHVKDINTLEELAIIAN